MTSKRELAARLKASTDASFTPTSSTLSDRLPELARAAGGPMVPRRVRYGRRVAAVVGTVGLVGWLSMAGAGAAVVGASATGVLPDPVQQFVADVLLNIGIDLPDPEEELLAEIRQNLEAGTQVSEAGGSPSGSNPSTGSSNDPSANGSNGPTSSDGSNGSAPGQGGSSPGNSGSAPGQGGSSPGNSGDAPGQGGSSPGNSGNAPGRSK